MQEQSPENQQAEKERAEREKERQAEKEEKEAEKAKEAEKTKESESLLSVPKPNLRSAWRAGVMRKSTADIEKEKNRESQADAKDKPTEVETQTESRRDRGEHRERRGLRFAEEDSKDKEKDKEKETDRNGRGSGHRVTFQLAVEEVLSLCVFIVSILCNAQIKDKPRIKLPSRKQVLHCLGTQQVFILCAEGRCCRTAVAWRCRTESSRGTSRFVFGVLIWA